MKKKLVLRLLAAALIFAVGSGEVLAAAGTADMEDLTSIEGTTETVDLTYKYNYIYTAPNNGVALSPAEVKAEQVVELAYPIIFSHEGGYSTVNPDDNGAVSVGRIQWHGKRALDILREIIETDPNKAYTLLGKALYEEITSDSTKWTTRTMTSEESKILTTFLAQMPKSKEVQDKMAKADIAGYVNRGIALGIRNVPALIYYADIENQGGSGRSKECAKALVDRGICKSYENITLNELYISGVYNSVMGKSIYLGRRASVYKLCTELGYTYCSFTDSIIPCVLNTYSSEKYLGEAWLQWALNTYAGAKLEITDKYDAATIEAVKVFQEANDLEVDGQAGKATLKELATMIMESGIYGPAQNTQQPASITVSKTKWEVNDTAASFSLAAKGNHAESTPVYTSSDANIIAITSDGKLDPAGPGTATITITLPATANYVSAIKKVTVIVYDDDVTAYTVPTATLAYKKSGMKKSDIMWLQAALNQLNAAGLLVDGDYGKATDAAVKAFQKKVGTTVDGEVGPATRKIIVKMLSDSANTKEPTDTNTSASSYPVPTRTLKKGCTGNDVKWMQDGINRVMGTKMPVDGEFGNTTMKYVKHFQTKYGLEVDGIFGAASRKKLQSLYTGETNTNGTDSGSQSNNTNDTANTSKYPVPARTLKKGCTGNDVKWMQDGINQVMGTKMPVDGEFGNTTMKYVKQFQTKYGLEVDGIFGTASRKKLQSLYTGGTASGSEGNNTNDTTNTSKYPVPTRTLKNGVTGDDVKWMQTALNSVLGTKMKVDGEFGNTTEKYVKQFQTKYGLEVDGIFGAASRKKLQSLY